MNLNISTITEELSAVFSISAVYQCSADPFLSMVMIDTQTPMQEEGVLYITESANLPKEPQISRLCALLSIGQPPAAYCCNHCNCIIMDKDVSVASVLNQLQHIFSKYYNWCMRLHQALYSGRGIQGIIDTALIYTAICITISA